MTNDELVAELKRIRAGAGLTQRDLADVLGYTQGWVNKVETGKRGIDLPVAEAWARACGFDLHLHFLTREQRMAELPIHAAMQGLDADQQDQVLSFISLIRAVPDGLVATALHFLEQVRDSRKAGTTQEGGSGGPLLAAE